MPTQEIDDFTEDTTPADGDLLVTVDISDTTDSPQGTTKKVQAQNLVVKKIRTSTGPAALTVGAVADGEVLKRSGSSIIGTAADASGPAGGDLTGTYPNPSVKSNLKTSDLTFIIDGGGSAITTGVKGDLGPIDFACTINSVTLLADQSGSIVIDIWKDTYANFPPLVGDSITASAKPTISSATKSQDTTLTGWITSISAGDILRFNVDSITSCQRVTLTLKVTLT